MVQYVADSVRSTETADQYHGYAQDNTVRVVAETKLCDQEDRYCRQKGEYHIVDDQVVFPLGQPVSGAYDNQGADEGGHEGVLEIASEIDAEPGSAHNGGQVGQEFGLRLTVHDFQIHFVHFLWPGCIPADLPGQVVQVVQPVVIEAGAPDPADLCKIMAAFWLDGCLDIALDRKNFTADEV